MATTLLLVSADESVIYVLRRYAKASGLAFAITERGTAALATARSVHPDVIILDIKPGAEIDDVVGWDTFRQLKADAETQNIPVIGCSWQARQGPDDVIEAVAGWLQKPMLYQDFVAVVSSSADYAGNNQSTTGEP